MQVKCRLLAHIWLRRAPSTNGCYHRMVPLLRAASRTHVPIAGSSLCSSSGIFRVHLRVLPTVHCVHALSVAIPARLNSSELLLYLARDDQSEEMQYLLYFHGFTKIMHTMSALVANDWLGGGGRASAAPTSWSKKSAIPRPSIHLCRAL